MYKDLTDKHIPDYYRKDVDLYAMIIEMDYRYYANLKEIHTVCRTFYGYSEQHLRDNVTAYTSKYGAIAFRQIKPDTAEDSNRIQFTKE